MKTSDLLLLFLEEIGYRDVEVKRYSYNVIRYVKLQVKNPYVDDVSRDALIFCEIGDKPGLVVVGDNNIEYNPMEDNHRQLEDPCFFDNLKKWIDGHMSRSSRVRSRNV